MKKNEILFISHGGVNKFFIVKGGKEWVAKFVGLGIYVAWNEERRTYRTGKLKKWWNFWW